MREIKQVYRFRYYDVVLAWQNIVDTLSFCKSNLIGVEAMSAVTVKSSG